MASFTVAVDRDFNQNGQKETDFIDCVAWRGTGEFVERNFSKGKMIVVSGRLQNRKWVDKNGNNRTTAEIVADNVYFGEPKKESDYTGFVPNNAVPANATPGNNFNLLEEDDVQLPF